MNDEDDKWKVPEYLENFDIERENRGLGNFGLEDIYLPIPDRALALEDLFVFVEDPEHVPALLVIAALTKGANPDITPSELRKLSSGILDQIYDRQTRGNKPKQDAALLKRVSELWRDAYLEQRDNKRIPIRPLVKQALQEDKVNREHSEDSASRRLERKLKEQLAAHLSQPILQSFESEYRDKFEAISDALLTFGVPQDASVFDDLRRDIPGDREGT